MGAAREDFLRRYATSPIHVPRLERLLAVYSGDDDEFAQRFIAWDRACPDGEAARIVAEILSAGDSHGGIARLSDQAVQGAIQWMSEALPAERAERAHSLRQRIALAERGGLGALVSFLESLAPTPDTSTT